MSQQLTQKERNLLQEQLGHEKLCVDKYKNYAQQARDPGLQQLFNQYASQEQNHYNTVNGILQGQTPNTAGGQGQQSPVQGSQNQQFQDMQGLQMGGRTDIFNAQDSQLVHDMLMTEQYVSGAYDTSIFASTNPSVRQSLQHIQKEEQKHGEGLLNYMQQNGMNSLQ